jgi:hypothetical protein
MTLLCGAENIGYLPRDINLAKMIEDEDKISEPSASCPVRKLHKPA